MAAPACRCGTAGCKRGRPTHFCTWCKRCRSPLLHLVFWPGAKGGGRRAPAGWMGSQAVAETGSRYHPSNRLARRLDRGRGASGAFAAAGTAWCKRGRAGGILPAPRTAAVVRDWTPVSIFTPSSIGDTNLNLLRLWPEGLPSGRRDFLHPSLSEAGPRRAAQDPMQAASDPLRTES